MSRALLLPLGLVAALGCNRPQPKDTPKPEADLTVGAKPAGATETAIFAAGCFWCVEAVFEDLKGVVDVTSGYAGGTKETAIYEIVGAGKTTHAEAVKITYDPQEISYGDLLRVLFATHDPTTKDFQMPDRGPQYRSAIFYESDEQKKVAEAYIKQLTDEKIFPDPIVTTLEPIGDGFFTAEAYHQDFVARHPDHPYVQQWSVPKLAKLRAKFPEMLKGAR
jgi:peptide-methionine (S)-S-oxide reductase